MLSPFNGGTNDNNRDRHSNNHRKESLQKEGANRGWRRLLPLIVARILAGVKGLPPRCWCKVEMSPLSAK